jgi:hypothetical protein
MPYTVTEHLDIAWLLLLASPAACSSQPSAATHPADGGTADAPLGDDASSSDATGDAAFAEAPHSAFPQVPHNAGPVLAAPKLVTITFTGDTRATTIGAFGDWIGSSSWLAAVGHDYGVGSGTHAQSVVLPGPPPSSVTDLDVQTLLEANLGNGTLPGPQADAGTPEGGAASDYLYLIVYPPGTTTGSFLAGPDTCTSQGGGHFIGGYHWETQSGAYHIPYAVVPTCSGGGQVESDADLETSASHEYIEAATDPFPYTDTGYGITDPSNPWGSTAGEVGDLCEGLTTVEAGFTVQRIWSNSAAKGQGAPCIPAPTTPFYDVAATPAQTQSVAPGGSATYTLTAFSSAAIPPWSLSTLVGYATFQPTLTLGTATIDNGQTTTLKVGVPAGTPSQSFASVFVTSSRSPADFNYWVVAVAVP